MELTRPTNPILTYGTYPVLVVLTAVAVVTALQERYDQSMVIVGLEALTVLVTGLIEWRRPLRTEWRMTGRSFFRRDLPFLGLGMVVVRFTEVAGLMVAALLGSREGFGPIGALPLAVQVVFALLLFDLLWYGYHRFAHSNDRWWRVHGVHHAPSQVYVLMHPVFHPLDLIVSRLVIAVLVFRLTGVAPDAVFVSLVILNLQQMMSHVNADFRVGPLNYLLVGTETHRYHHGAETRGNYASVLAIWDLLFGTFVYRPTEVPARLGLDDPRSFPDPERFHTTLAWALRRTKPQPVAP